MDSLARFVITVGGIGTIIAVSMVFLFLGYVVYPLFSSAEVDPPKKLGKIWNSPAPLHIAVDEYQVLGWALHGDGTLQVFRLDTGETIDSRRLFGDATLTAASFTLREGIAMFGFANGTIRSASIKFATRIQDAPSVPQDVRQLPEGELAAYEGGIVERTPIGQFRTQTVHVTLEPPVQVADSAIRLIDHVPPGVDLAGTGQTSSDTSTAGAEEGVAPEGGVSGSGGLMKKYPTFAVYCDDGELRWGKIQEKKAGLMAAFGAAGQDDSPKLEARTRTLPFDRRRDQQPRHLLLSGSDARAVNAFLAFEDGQLQRIDLVNNVAVVETVDLTPQPDVALTQLRFLLGRETLVAGDAAGTVSAWFKVQPEQGAETGDGRTLVRAHGIAGGDSPVTSLGMSQRSRSVAAGYANGKVRVLHVTTDLEMAQLDLGTSQPVTNITVAPKWDGLAGVSGGEFWQAQIDPKHPEATLEGLFLPVWYEGYSQPMHTWQSSSGTEDTEPKFGLTPLVFGTLKATFYSMLMGAPLALLAAIYTSEFLHGSTRAKIKPGIELMASLPSVVLGFLAALVFAPYVARVVPSLLACFITVPAILLLFGYLIQMLPYRIYLALSHVRFLLICLVLPIGFWLAFLLGQQVEWWLFAGDLRAWLKGDVGNSVGAWMLLLFPLSALLTSLLVGMHVNPVLARRSDHWGRSRFTSVNLAKFLLAGAVAVLLALAVSSLLDVAGLDPRGTFVGKYDPRNALVVGFVMGFAVVPIIYTIADDALAAVPDHLRSGSLGAGATPWQTAVRIVIPTAMSGLFSALMVGLGRAVGETMIVLMATGNTPIMDMNIFNGFRTLAANIAVELPEAVQNSTHYRTLFLAALTLFLLTFVVNTTAEIVRLRFRRRAYQL